MIRRMTAFAALAGLLCLTGHVSVAQPDKKPSAADLAKSKKALQEVQDFIGLWNLEGTQKVGAKTEAWKEKVNWGWKFKDGDAWLTVAFAEGKGKYYTEGELRYDVAQKKYVLTLTPAGKGAAKEEYVGDFKTGTLKVERKDAKSGDVYRLTMNTLSEGDRFAFTSTKQDGGKGIFSAVYKMDGNKDGLVKGGPKKPECIVSGGAANIQVSYNGKTYYVCCSGCRDEFNANPAKYAK
jgi:YHS domain-containing protein